MYLRKENNSQYPSDGKLAIVEKEPEYISTLDAAGIMDVTQQHVQYLCRAKEIECKKFGRDWMVNKASAEDWKRKKSGRPKGS